MKCGSGCYCSVTCKNAHAPKHLQLCSAIRELEAIEFRKQDFSVREVNQVEVKNQLVKLVGEKPVLRCQLDGVDCEALWDTGSMISMVDASWFNEQFPEESILSLTQFLEGDNLHIFAANKTKVEVQGVAILNFSFNNNNNNNFSVPVPFIICKNNLTQPLIGYNVIKYLIESKELIGDIPSILLDTLPSLTEKTVSAVINIIRRPSFGKYRVDKESDRPTPPYTL